MKYIKKVASSVISEVNGAVVDTLNVTDKTTNAPSVRVVEELFNNIGNNTNATQMLTQTISATVSATAHVMSRKLLLGEITVPDGYSYIGTFQTDYTGTSNIKGIYVYTEGTSVYADVNNTSSLENVTIVCTALFIKTTE